MYCIEVRGLCLSSIIVWLVTGVTHLVLLFLATGNERWMGQVFMLNRFCLALVILSVGACARGPGVGCYVFDWIEFEPQSAVPIWLVPDGVKLDADSAEGGRLVANPRPLIEPQAGNPGVTWDGILYDRTWTMMGDTIDIVLKDLGYNEWHIRLFASGDRWRGEAVYTTTMGMGEERSFPGIVEAHLCEGG